MGFGGFPFSQSHNFDATNPCPEMFSSMSLQRDVWRILHVCLIYVDLFFILSCWKNNNVSYIWFIAYGHIAKTHLIFPENTREF